MQMILGGLLLIAFGGVGVWRSVTWRRPGRLRIPVPPPGRFARAWDRGGMALMLGFVLVGAVLVVVGIVAMVLVAIGWLLFVVGVALAFALAYADSHRERVSLVRAAGRALHVAYRRLWAKMP